MKHCWTTEAFVHLVRNRWEMLRKIRSVVLEVVGGIWSLNNLAYLNHFEEFMKSILQF